MANKNLPDKDIGCHRTNFEQKCFDLVTEGVCNRWIGLQGLDPQTGAMIDTYNCIDNTIPFLLLEIGRQSRQTGAAVESFRNQMVLMNEESYRQITKQ